MKSATAQLNNLRWYSFNGLNDLNGLNDWNYS